ncbi:GMC family oxidoreductase N-terminal domain-containing protein [Mycobacterium stomatepiae]|uniref:GMC family oxidoreductase n=1 Tax=Mycobacterium stomatepiae TaxID=470076 RepID=UPI0013CF4C5D|nr:GMC family oxidoreductase N-terminal domain-containing protein [Mycobacterium stomatepiae]MCV7167309.1 GMC family oxidoreductase N-terminal domain-containing protein [Mycobacterium stomatepiae]
MSTCDSLDVDFEVRAQENQRRLATELQSGYDFVVCGAGSSGSVVARRIAENPSATVLLLEAGPPADAASVSEPSLWITNFGTERDWAFTAEPSPHVNGRQLPMSMGRGLGGASSINAMMWVHGHRSDWDFYASESGDPAWGHAAVLAIFRRIEDWQGVADPDHRGRGGLVHVAPIPDPSPCAAAAVEAASRIGAPSFASLNGLMMEANVGAALNDMRIKQGRRQSVFDSYLYPYLDRPNLTVLTGATVHRVIINRQRAVGVEFSFREGVQRVAVNAEAVLSMGAINTPKVLMHSGVGDERQLRCFGIPIAQHLPGVGMNFQDHIGFTCVWELPEPRPVTFLPEASMYWRSEPTIEHPDLFATFGVAPLASPEVALRYSLPQAGWNLFGALARPVSRGTVQLTGPKRSDPVRLDANVLSHPDDMAAARRCIRALREVGSAPEMRPFVKREALPGSLTDSDMNHFLRDAAMTYWHRSGTAKMGRDQMSVVDADLAVYGVEGLRVADASILPRVTTGNTMAPCVVIGERAADIIKSKC